MPVSAGPARASASWSGSAILLLVVLAVVSSARWLRGLTEPVDDLVAAAGRVEAGDLDVQVTERGPREARALARAFNQMSARLAVDERERRGFLADVTHELRTPLAVVRANVEAIADGVYPADPRTWRRSWTPSRPSSDWSTTCARSPRPRPVA